MEEKKRTEKSFKNPFTVSSLKYQSSGEAGVSGCVDYSAKLLRKQYFITIKF